ncbi:origin of replication complex subunit 1A-like isoform X2 [Aristolochia californica]|uniref:origin of replication complex subunit 1A-like isoform X2 n=1 Tax=Aristolochia californica TaxID=171875 RepID=UPI0035DEE606
MAETPEKLRSYTPSKSKLSPASVLSGPPTPGASVTPRRSPRLTASVSDAQTPNGFIPKEKCSDADLKTPKSSKSRKKSLQLSDKPSTGAPIPPVSPDPVDSKKRKRAAEKNLKSSYSGNARPKKRLYYRKVVYDEGEFEIGDDVYVKRREDASADDEDPEVEECRICFKSGKSVMIECDTCLSGFHLKCLKPPLKDVPEGDWICGFCDARKRGEDVQLPVPPKGKKIRRTAREKLLSSDLWAARIESLWKEPDGRYWFKGRWYIIPEETKAGRQPHNLRRELYLTNDYADIEMESIIRHCQVLSPKEYSKASNDGDDIFLCEYEYDIHWHSFKRVMEAINEDEDSGSDTEGDSGCEEEIANRFSTSKFPDHKYKLHEVAANSRKGRIFGLQKIGIKKIPEHVRCHNQTDLERAKATLLLATLPKSLPCRDKEMEEIMSFIKGAICEQQCLGRCLYIHGVPGTGKTMSVLAVVRHLRSEIDAGRIRPSCFVEINGLKLASPENIYRVFYEALTGHRVGWKKALHLLNERFSEGNRKVGNVDNQPCILLIDELDLLVTRNQSVLYNILDWPTKPNSKLIVIGIANTMDLPEKLLPRISSRMGIQRLCFGPYNYQQLQEIILSRLKGIDAFEKQAVEFASRKVAAISGDARRALEICRRAAEIANYRLKQLSSPSTASASTHDNITKENHLVSMTDIEAAIQEMFQAPHIQVMKSSSKLSKILLVAMVHELYTTGMGEVTFERLAMTVARLCRSNGETCPEWDTILKAGCNLGQCRIILCEEGAKHRLQKLQLNFSSDDVAFALKDCPELPWLAKYL